MHLCPVGRMPEQYINRDDKNGEQNKIRCSIKSTYALENGKISTIKH